MKNKTVKMVLAVVVLGVCCGAYAGVKTYVAHQEQKESEEDSEESTTVFTASTDNIKSLDFMVDDTETTFEKDDEHRDNVSDDENFNELVSVIKRVFENMMDKTSIPVNNSEKNNGNNKEVLTMQEKIHMAEESYSKFEKPKDMKMYSVYLD